MSLDPNKTYLGWNGTTFPNSTKASFKAPAGSTIDWGDGTIETFATASTVVNTHTYTDGLTKHTIVISGLTSIGVFAFNNCTSLTSVTIGNSVTSIGVSAFDFCGKLTSVVIPNSVTSISSAAFRNCSSLTSIMIPNSVTSIPSQMFAYDTSLTSVTIGNSVTSIGGLVFSDCRSLKTIALFPETPPTLGSTDTIPTTTTIYVQQSSKEAYKAATNWTAFADKIDSNDIYLSIIRFNKKNKEYINEKADDLKSYVDNKEVGGDNWKLESSYAGEEVITYYLPSRLNTSGYSIPLQVELTAGDGITITDDIISADVQLNGSKIYSSTSYAVSYYVPEPLSSSQRNVYLQRKLTAGDGIDITDDIISVTSSDASLYLQGGKIYSSVSYAANYYLPEPLSSSQLNVNLQRRLTAGAGIDITNDIISATGSGTGSGGVEVINESWRYPSITISSIGTWAPILVCKNGQFDSILNDAEGELKTIQPDYSDMSAVYEFYCYSSAITLSFNFKTAVEDGSDSSYVVDKVVAGVNYIKLVMGRVSSDYMECMLITN